jgi:hypothetical protein
MSRLLRLYPRPWRDRYGEEFDALISSRPPSVVDRLDIIRGAIDARLHPQLQGPDRVPDRSGFATLAGFGVLVAAVIIMANGPVRYDEYGTYREGEGGLAFVLLAAALLSVGLHRVVVRLPAGASVARISGWMAIIAGPVWSIMPWVMPLGVLFLVSVMVVAVGAGRAHIWPAWLVAIIILLPAIPAGLMAVLAFLPWYTLRVAGIDALILLAPIGGLWLAVGFGLLRGFPRPIAA